MVDIREWKGVELKLKSKWLNMFVSACGKVEKSWSGKNLSAGRKVRNPLKHWRDSKEDTEQTVRAALD